MSIPIFKTCLHTAHPAQWRGLGAERSWALLPWPRCTFKLKHMSILPVCLQMTRKVKCSPWTVANTFCSEQNWTCVLLNCEINKFHQTDVSDREGHWNVPSHTQYIEMYLFIFFSLSIYTSIFIFLNTSGKQRKLDWIRAYGTKNIFKCSLLHLRMYFTWSPVTSKRMNLKGVKLQNHKHYAHPPLHIYRML